jgi:hypothetical protein
MTTIIIELGNVSRMMVSFCLQSISAR